MKKVLYLSGTLTVLLLMLFITGWAPADDAVKEALRRGNQLFELADYNKALSTYETGLTANADSKSLNFNAAKAAYLLGDYEKTIEYCGKSADTVEKFLMAGNICYRAGEAVSDINQKMQFYAQALQFYKEGIIKYPQDVSLKYNYEFVERKLEELAENMEQENNQQGEEGENQENQEQESLNGENSQGEQEQQEQQEQESENSENSQGSQEQDSEQNEETGDNQNQSQAGDDQQEEGYSQDQGENATDQEAVERILQMLENQEEQSLKNNQEVVGGNEGKNGW